MNYHQDSFQVRNSVSSFRAVLLQALQGNGSRAHRSCGYVPSCEQILQLISLTLYNWMSRLHDARTSWCLYHLSLCWKASHLFPWSTYSRCGHQWISCLILRKFMCPYRLDFWKLTAETICILVLLWLFWCIRNLFSRFELTHLRVISSCWRLHSCYLFLFFSSKTWPLCSDWLSTCNTFCVDVAKAEHKPNCLVKRGIGRITIKCWRKFPLAHHFPTFQSLNSISAGSICRSWTFW